MVRSKIQVAIRAGWLMVKGCGERTILHFCDLDIQKEMEFSRSSSIVNLSVLSTLLIISKKGRHSSQVSHTMCHPQIFSNKGHQTLRIQMSDRTALKKDE
jgi:E3 ubiquitin-protein ligase DOA10